MDTSRGHVWRVGWYKLLEPPTPGLEIGVRPFNGEDSNVIMQEGR